MAIQVNLDNIPLVRGHAKQARIDLLKAQLVGKFGDDAKQVDLPARLAKMDTTQLEAVAIRLVTLDDIDAVLDGVSPTGKPGSGPKR